MGRTRHLLTLSPLAGLEDTALLLLRAGIGAFLVWGVSDNITSPEHMAAFQGFLTKHGFPAAGVLAPFEVWLQAALGVALILGLLTRWAGLILAVNFVIAIAMVDRLLGLRGAFGSICLVLIGLYLAARGGGRLSLDQLLLKR